MKYELAAEVCQLHLDGAADDGQPALGRGTQREELLLVVQKRCGPGEDVIGQARCVAHYAVVAGKAALFRSQNLRACQAFLVSYRTLARLS